MLGWIILFAGLVLGNVIYIFLTLLVARVLGLHPPQAMLGLFWRPVRFRIGGTAFQVGPLPVTASVAMDVAGSESDAVRAQASPFAHAVMAVFAFSALLLLGIALAHHEAVSAVLAALKAYLTLPLHIGTHMNLGTTIEGMAVHTGIVGTIAVVMAVMAAINLIPLPPFAGFTLVNDIVHALRGRPFADTVLKGLLKLHVLWLLVLVFTLVVRHLGG